mmetsp:Transcript_39150/g.33011  ORF Transcript_39150/g.33011 Transcript_39150/m.33011 type:complete len:104 (+) Transcript_39150:47-358(+)
MCDHGIDNLIKVFNHFDPNGDQNISFEEAIPMAKAFNLNRLELIQVFNEIDENLDGFLQLNEWVDFLRSTTTKNFIKNKILNKVYDEVWILNELSKPIDYNNL